MGHSGISSQLSASGSTAKLVLWQSVDGFRPSTPGCRTSRMKDELLKLIWMFPMHILHGEYGNFSPLLARRCWCMDSQKRNALRLGLKARKKLKAWPKRHKRQNTMYSTTLKTYHLKSVICSDVKAPHHPKRSMELWWLHMGTVSSSVITVNTLRNNQQKPIVTQHYFHCFVEVNVQPCLGWIHTVFPHIPWLPSHSSSCSWTPFGKKNVTWRTPRRWPMWKMWNVKKNAGNNGNPQPSCAMIVFGSTIIKRQK